MTGCGVAGIGLGAGQSGEARAGHPSFCGQKVGVTMPQGPDVS